MRKIRGYILPDYSPEIGENSLFHYTSATGLMGILQSGQIWCTASHCTNDESEMAIGEELLTREFSSVIQKIYNNKDPIIEIFYSRGVVDIYQYAENYKDLIINILFSTLKTYIACFCQPATREIFYHGLLSQWRAYGADGGYAIQFSKEKLLGEIDTANNEISPGYDVHEVYYTPDNPFKDEFLKNRKAFHSKFKQHLDELAGPLSLEPRTMPSPLSGLPKRALESLIDYLLYTKNPHFSEEREVRLSHLELATGEAGSSGTDFFQRNGLIVPYRATNKEFLPLLDCVEGIIVGPGSRMAERYESVRQLVRSTGRKIPVRASRIPFTRD